MTNAQDPELELTGQTTEDNDNRVGDNDESASGANRTTAGLNGMTR